MILYAATIFLSAFLLFQVQPMIAKIILPWFGGTAAVWTACMLFFQSALLAGYLYSHWAMSRLGACARGGLHVGLLAVSLLALPVAPADRWKPLGAQDPTLGILLVLAMSVGLPYLLLSTTGPLVQAWFARAFPAASPYRLFALSNIGSMLALLGYPFLFEPLVATRRQAYLWSGAYALFVVLCGVLAWRSRGLEEPGGGVPAEDAGDAPAASTKGLWAGLAACASALLLASTNYITQDVAPIPFLWVLPLSLYLLSFILTFERAGWYHRALYLPLTAVALAAMAYAFTEQDGLEIRGRVAVFCGALFLCCMTCHGEVAALKPHPRYLTGYYLMISLGGALGGLFVGVVAPYLFPLNLELPVAIVACALLVLLVHWRDGESPLHRTADGWGWIVAAGCALGLAVTLVWDVQQTFRDYRLVVRNFYGSLLTIDYGKPGDREAVRKFTHGAINHGEQWLHPGRRRDPTSYFGPGTGVAKAIRSKDRDKPQRIGITGLGAGVMLTYARAGDYYRIYEINPLVVEVARSEFTFLKDCPAKVELVMGDARLSMEREEAQNFDVLHLDAFSSDSVPVHLLTREAFELYFRHLKPDGVLVLHISNRYLDLQPVAARAAQSLGKHALLVEDYGDDDAGYFGTDMVLVANQKEFFDQQLFMGAKPPEVRADVSLWTDDHSNLFRILK
ncbi:MAG: fused MFS/spermidine synthase [Bryobacteraceae bacterium]|nr:fused MFS/spermidine synthase [Bryobacteraceae bacterium]